MSLKPNAYLLSVTFLYNYSEFREKRHNIRKRNKTIKGLDLTDTLDRYAQTGKKYTDILEQNTPEDVEVVAIEIEVETQDGQQMASLEL